MNKFIDKIKNVYVVLVYIFAFCCSVNGVNYILKCITSNSQLNYTSLSFIICIITLSFLIHIQEEYKNQELEEEREKAIQVWTTFNKPNQNKKEGRK